MGISHPDGPVRSHPTPSGAFPPGAGLLLALASSLVAPAFAAAPGPLAAGDRAAGSLAQVESFMLKPGSNVGPATKVKPTNCVTAADGSITCDTTIENAPGDTPAQPQYQPFN